MFKTIIGVLLLATIINILTLYNFPFAFQSIMKGALIIIAIFIDARARERIVETKKLRNILIDQKL